MRATARQKIERSREIERTREKESVYGDVVFVCVLLGGGGGSKGLASRKPWVAGCGRFPRFKVRTKKCGQVTGKLDNLIQERTQEGFDLTKID
jgi:hypothetical protein